MAWTAPSTFVAGAILTAAQLNTNVRDNSLAGGPIYATEAARATAIPSPFEGQRAFITAPTETAATGSSTILPLGINTYYDGAGWVCLTPVSARASGEGTTTSTSFTASLSGSPGTNASVTLRTGATALITVSAILSNSTVDAGMFMGTAISGATTVAADFTLAMFSGGKDVGASYQYMVAALTPGINVFTLQYRTGSSGTGTAKFRGITVVGV